jgi:HSP20 family molecular chaperone IbpA
MHTIINTLPPDSRRGPARPALAAAFRRPNYDCQDLPGALRLVVFVPGVDASGVEIEARGPDLLVIAHKTRFVRVNWTALHLEGAQRDYRLRLRLGSGFNFAAMQAEIHDGVLVVTLPKREPKAAGEQAAFKRVA